jgi:hypothetical protein
LCKEKSVKRVIIIIIFLIVLMAGLVYSESENALSKDARASIRIGTQTDLEFSDPLMVLYFGMGKQFILGITFDVVLANGLQGWDPVGGMDLNLWIGPVYIGGGFLTSLSMVGFSENSVPRNFLLKTGLEIPIWKLGPGRLILNGGVISSSASVTNLFTDSSQFGLGDLTFALSVGYRIPRYFGDTYYGPF